MTIRGDRLRQIAAPLQVALIVLWAALTASASTAPRPAEAAPPRQVEATPTSPGSAGGAVVVESVELAPAIERPVGQQGETFFTNQVTFAYHGGRVVLSGDPPPDTLFGIDDRMVLTVRRPDGRRLSYDRTFNTDCLRNEPIPPEDLTSLFQRGENVVSVTLTDVCGSEVRAFGRVMLSEVRAPARAAPAESSGPLWPVALAVGAGAAGLALVVARRRRRPAPVAGGPLSEMGQLLPEQEAAENTRFTALLTVRRAEAEQALPDGVRSYTLRETPLVIGSGARCHILLPPGEGVAAEHARVWIRDRRIMLHHLAAGYTTTLAESPVTWASLEAGDEVAIGPYVVRCASLTELPPPVPAPLEGEG